MLRVRRFLVSGPQRRPKKPCLAPACLQSHVQVDPLVNRIRSPRGQVSQGRVLVSRSAVSRMHIQASRSVSMFSCLVNFEGKGYLLKNTNCPLIPGAANSSTRGAFVFIATTLAYSVHGEERVCDRWLATRLICTNPQLLCSTVRSCVLAVRQVPQKGLLSISCSALFCTYRLKYPDTGTLFQS